MSKKVVQDHSMEADSLQQVVQLLCSKYACLGIDVMIVMANKSDNSISYHGSRTGMDFLCKKPDILSEFFLFSRADKTTIPKSQQTTEHTRSQESAQHESVHKFYIPSMSYLNGKSTKPSGHHCTPDNEEDRGTKYTCRKDVGTQYTCEEDERTTYTCKKDVGTQYTSEKDTVTTYTCKIDVGIQYIREKDIGTKFTSETDGGTSCESSVEHPDAMQESDAYNEDDEGTAEGREAFPGKSDVQKKKESTHDIPAEGTLYSSESSVGQPDALMQHSSTHKDHIEGKVDTIRRTEGKLDALIDLSSTYQGHDEGTVDPIESSEDACVVKESTHDEPYDFLQHKNAHHDHNYVTKYAYISNMHENIVGQPFSLIEKNTQSKNHKGEQSYMCEVCGYSTRYPRSLTIHQRIHTGEKPFKCDLCDFRTRDSRRLPLHKKRHLLNQESEEAKPFLCDICGVRKRRADDLHVHKITHTGEYPFKCELCKFKTIWANKLVIHRRKHTGEMPFECDLCDFKAKRDNTLKKHKRMHLSPEKEAK